MKNIFYGRQNQGNDQYNHQNVNDASAIITKAIPKEGFGEIKFKGTFYKAKSEDSNIEIKMLHKLHIDETLKKVLLISK